MLRQMESPYVFAVTSANFDAEVAKKSMEVPILLDFWAEWCGPCKTFAPILVAVADEYAGAFLVGKVDTEAEPRIAEAFGVRGIPFAALLSQGQPVDAFSGAIDERGLRDFLAKSGVQPNVVESEAEPEDSDSAGARLRGALEALRTGCRDTVKERLAGIVADDEEYADAERILHGLPIFEITTADPNVPAAQALLRGAELLGEGQVRPAVEELLESIAIDKGLHDGIARRAIVLCFLLIGEGPDAEDELAAMRRRLATLVY